MRTASTGTIHGEPGIICVASSIPGYFAIRFMPAPAPMAGERSGHAIVDGRARKASGFAKPRDEWNVLLRDNHPGYIRVQTQLIQ